MESKDSKKLDSIIRELDKRKREHSEGKKSKRTFRRIIRKMVLGVAGIFFVLSAIFFFNFFRLNSGLIEGHIKQGIIPNLTQGKFDLKIGTISGNLIYGVQMENILLQNFHFKTGGTALTIPKASLEYSLFDILFGKIVLQKLKIDDPVLTLKRNIEGRGIWDFSSLDEGQKHIPQIPKTKETKWQESAAAQSVADQYLSHIEINNLGIIIPSPVDLIRDEFVSRIIRLPSRTFQYNGIKLLLKKFPSKKFISHVFKISTPKDPEFLTFSFTKLRETGDFSVSFDALEQNFNMAVKNLGDKGRKINLFDGRQKERLNLEWVWARDSKKILKRIRGLKGVIRVPEISDMVSKLLQDDHQLAGSFELKVFCPPDKGIFDSEASITISSSSVNLPYFPPIKDLNLKLASKDRVANLKKLSLNFRNYFIENSGSIDFSDIGNIFGNIESAVQGDRVKLDGSYKRISKGVRDLTINLKRNSGEARLSLTRELKGRKIAYKDFSVKAGIVKNRSAIEVLPMNLLGKAVSEKVKPYFDKVDLVGPLKLETYFPTTNEWINSIVSIDFDNTKIVNRNNAKDKFELSGKAILSSGSLDLNDLTAKIDNLSIQTNGKVVVLAEKPYVKSYDLHFIAGVEAGKAFGITSERLQNSLGLTHKPDFNKIYIKGNKLLEISLGSETNTNKGRVSIDKLRFYRRKKSIWAQNVDLKIETNRFNFTNSEKPEKLTGEGSLKFFGMDLSTKLAIDLVNKKIESLVFKGGGSNFNTILEAVKSQPEGKQLLRKYPVKASGKFDFALIGKGKFIEPYLEGWFKFPFLNLRVRDLAMSLPFDVSLKNKETGGYAAKITAGKAYLNYKNTKFSLDKAKVDLDIQNTFEKAGPNISINAQTNVFATWIKATGKILLGKSRFKNIALSLASKDISKLASEIARIGNFRVPFKLAGKFNGYANLNGRFAAPDSTGKVTFKRIGLDFPLTNGKGKTSLKAKDFGGTLRFSKKGNKKIEFALEKVAGKVIDANVTASGKVLLKELNRGLRPYLDNLSADFKNLSGSALFSFLQQGIIPPGMLDSLKVSSGKFHGKMRLSGTPDKIISQGQVELANGSLLYKGLKDRLENVYAGLTFEGRTDTGYSRIGLDRFKARFGRTLVHIPEGWIEDPTKTGKLFLSGKVSKVFPADILKLFGGMRVAAVSFPKEGHLNGELTVSGTMFKPKLKAKLESTSMNVKYSSEGADYTIPIGENKLELTYNIGSGKAIVEKGALALLGGKISLDKAAGTFKTDRPFSFGLAGNISGIDINRFKVSDAESFKGIIGGKFNAEWQGSGKRDANFHLDFKNIFIPKIPVVDPNALKGVGVEFIQKPDFRTGKLNCYVTTEEEGNVKGKLLVADGLFAGPHMRLELGNSEFNPMALRLSGKLMLNPQSLRKTTLGRKLRKLSVTVQDKRTGIPYIDLSLSGQWNKPELIARAISKKATKRAKRNFIKRIFGRRAHKASVHELMLWFPGWKKGM